MGMNESGERVYPEERLEGKTIEKYDIDMDAVGIRFTDGTYLYGGVMISDDEPTINYTLDVPDSMLLLLGVIDQAEVDRRIKERKEKLKEFRRKIYEKLKPEFEPGQ